MKKQLFGKRALVLGLLQLVLFGFLASVAVSGTTTTEAAYVPQAAYNVYYYAANNNGAAQPGYVGNRYYSNDGRSGEQVLPTTDDYGDTISYREYDIYPYQPGVNRGAERVVIGYDDYGDIINAFYTSDHYYTFTQFE